MLNNALPAMAPSGMEKSFCDRQTKRTGSVHPILSREKVLDSLYASPQLMSTTIDRSNVKGYKAG